MFNSFSFMGKDVEPDFYYRLTTEVSKLKFYFYKFAGVKAEEAMQKTIMHTLTHFNGNYNSLAPYVKKLAREITKDNGRLVFVDFLEQTLSDDYTDFEESRANTPTTVINDFSGGVVDLIDLERDDGSEIISLALAFMPKFMTMCESIINRDTTDMYYPDIYIKECLKLSHKFPNFNALCVNLYLRHKDGMEAFSNTEGEGNVWKETDYLLINQNLSKRIKLRNKKTKELVVDADLEDFYIDGKLDGKQGIKTIMRVKYEDLWEQLCDLVDAKESNVMKYIIGDHFIIKTLGGSLSIVNPDLYNIYDLIRTEILTNVIKNTYGRILNVGSSCIYLLFSENCKREIPPISIKGIDINLELEDITDTVSLG